MAPTSNKQPKSGVGKEKKERKHLTLAEKLEIIDMKDKQGYTYAKIANEKKMNEASVRTIYKNRDKIKSHGIQTAQYDSKHIFLTKSRAKLEMEHLLLIWIEDCAHRYVNQKKCR